MKAIRIIVLTALLIVGLIFTYLLFFTESDTVYEKKENGVIDWPLDTYGCYTFTEQDSLIIIVGEDTVYNYKN